MATWEWEEARGSITSTWAPVIFRELDRGTDKNTILKHKRILPDALIPAGDDRSDARKVVRRPSKVRCMRAYPPLRSMMSKASEKVPGWAFVVMTPPYVGLPLESRAPTSITESRNHRIASCAFLVWWSCGRMTLPRPGTPAEAPRGTHPAVDRCVVRRRTTGRRDRAGPSSGTGRGPLLGGGPPGGGSVASVV